MATSICIPICSLERAAIDSALSPAEGHCSSRVLYRSTDDQGETTRIPGRRGEGLTVPKACCTPTVPGSITFTVDPMIVIAATPTRPKATRRRIFDPEVPARPAARVRRMNATKRRRMPITRLPMVVPELEVGEMYCAYLPRIPPVAP